jgi:hypothetical protein
MWLRFRGMILESFWEDTREAVENVAPLHFAVAVVGEGTAGCLFTFAAHVPQRW